MAKKKKVFEELDMARKIAFKGAVAAKSTDLLRHARDPVALGGDVQGFVGLSILGVASDVAARPLTFRKKKKRKKRR